MALDWLPAVTAPAGALVGAVAGYTFSRARLTLTIDRITLQAVPAASEQAVAVNGNLFQLVQNFFPQELPVLESGSAATSERNYTTYLRYLQQVLDFTMQTLHEAEAAAAECRALVRDKQHAQLRARYLVAQGRLWPLAAGLCARGGDLFPSKVPDHDARPAVLEIVQDNDRDYYIDLPGVSWLKFAWSDSPGISSARVQAAAERAVTAFAHEDEDELVAYFSAIGTGVSEALAAGVLLQKEVKDELERFARLRVDFVVSNVGRSGVSLASEAAVRIDLKGYALSSEAAGAGSRTPTVGGVSQLPLRVLPSSQLLQLEAAARTEKVGELRLDPMQPILIEAGRAVRLSGISEDLLRDREDGRLLTHAYMGAERTLVLTVGRFSQRAGLRKKNGAEILRIRSRSVLFRDLRLTRAISS